MREIKFRYYDSNTKKFILLDDLIPNRNLSQYTGLEDKNGKEIYEGDIIEQDNKCNKFVVKWFDDLYWDGCGAIHPGFYLSAPYLDAGNLDYHLHLSGSISKVIGNIYENPELLEK